MLQTNVTGICGECLQCSGHTGFVPAHGMCAFPVHIAQAPGCSPGSGPWVACTSQAYAAQVQVLGYSPKAQAWLDLGFVPSPAWAAQTTRSLISAPSPGTVHLIPSVVPDLVSGCTGWVGFVSLLGCWFLTATLPVDVNQPESLEVFG